jgi:PAS domain S-box-containing protein
LRKGAIGDSQKTKAQLRAEVEELRRQITDLQNVAITHQRAEDARRESEERYRTLVEHTYDFVIEASIDGRFLYVSSDYTETLGYDPDELLGKNVFEFMHPEDMASALEAFSRGLAQFTSEQAVFRYRHKTGEWRWFESTGRPFRTAAGEIRVMVVSRDITARKQAEAALQEEAQVSSALVRVGEALSSLLNTPAILDHLCRLTAQELGSICSYTFLWRAEELAFVPVAHWGDTPEQWEALRVFHLGRATIPNLLARLESEEIVQTGESDGDLLLTALQRTVGVTASVYMALRHGDTLIGLQSVGYHMPALPLPPTQQRIARGIAHLASIALENAQLFEQAESANRLKSDFIATISHELRTPLHVIMGYNDLLLDGEFGALEEEQREILQRMERSIRELSEIVKATLDVSRLDAGRLPMVIQKTDLLALLEELKRETESLQATSRLEFFWRLSPNVPPIFTDPVKVKVVLKNLLSNAVKFTESGSVTVAVTMQQDSVEISVTDTGIGITPESFAIIFEPFRQAENPMTRQYGGIGLGLYVVRRMLELLEGSITMESAPGKGSTFRVRLPLTIVEGLTAAPAN